jgi:ferredoxin
MPPDETWRLRVDWIRCEGFGVCGDLLPELVELDDWRFPILPAEGVPVGLLNEAQRAADCCPVRALHLERRRPAG